MKKTWPIVWTLMLLLIGLGGVVFALALLMDADIVRIADAVFSGYDMVSIIDYGNKVVQSFAALF